MRNDARKRVKKRERKKKAVDLVKQQWIRLGNVRRFV